MSSLPSPGLPPPLALARHPRVVAIFALLFCITYFEPFVLAGVRFAVLWRALFVLPAVLLIVLRPWPVTPLTRTLETLFWCWLIHSAAPLASVLLGASSPAEAIELTAKRSLPLVAAALTLSLSAYAHADAVLRTLPVFLCGVSLFLLTGVIEPSGQQFELSHVAEGLELTAYVGTFQNQHSASLTHAIAASIAFAVAAGRPPREAFPYLLAGVGCVLLTAATTARAGLAGFVIGLVCIAVVRRDWRLLGWPLAVVVIVIVIILAGSPAFLEFAQNRLLGRTIYQDFYTLDTLTSGRVHLQEAAIAAYLGFTPLEQLFGVGQQEFITRMGELAGFSLLAHNGFIDELTMHGLFGLLAFLAVFLAAGALAWENARRGYPLGLALVALTAVFAALQSADYSLQMSLVALALLIETAVRLEHSEPVFPDR